MEKKKDKGIHIKWNRGMLTAIGALALIAIPASIIASIETGKGHVSNPEQEVITLVDTPKFDAHKEADVNEYKTYINNKLANLHADASGAPIDYTELNNSETIYEAVNAFEAIAEKGLHTFETTATTIEFHHFEFDEITTSLADYKTSLATAFDSVYTGKVLNDVSSIASLDSNAVPFLVSDLADVVVNNIDTTKGGQEPTGTRPTFSDGYDSSETPQYKADMIAWLNTGWRSATKLNISEINDATSYDEATMYAEIYRQNYSLAGGTDASNLVLPPEPVADDYSTTKIAEMIDYLKSHYDHIEHTDGSPVDLDALDSLTTWDELNTWNDDQNTTGLQTIADVEVTELTLKDMPAYNYFTNATITDWIDTQKIVWSAHNAEEVKVADAALDAIKADTTTYTDNILMMNALIVSAVKSINDFTNTIDIETMYV